MHDGCNHLRKLLIDVDSIYAPASQWVDGIELPAGLPAHSAVQGVDTRVSIIKRVCSLRATRLVREGAWMRAQVDALRIR